MGQTRDIGTTGLYIELPDSDFEVSDDALRFALHPPGEAGFGACFDCEGRITRREYQGRKLGLGIRLTRLELPTPQ